MIPPNPVQQIHDSGRASPQPRKQQTAFEPSSRPSVLSLQCAGSPQEEPQAATQPPKESQLEPQVLVHSQPVIVATHTRNVQASVLNHRINILNRNAVETSHARGVFGAASAIMVLVRVSTLVLRLSVSSR